MHINTEQGRKLAGTLLLPEQDIKSGILFIHGWNSDQVSSFAYATELVEHGYACLTFDLGGHGLSDGDKDVLERRDFLADALAAYDNLSYRTSGVVTYVVGSSFGGYLAALLAGERSAGGIVLRAPANYPDTGFQGSKQLSPEEAEEFRASLIAGPLIDTGANRSLGDYSGSVLIVESEHDQVIDKNIIAGYRESVAAPSDLTYQILIDAGHSISRDQQARDRFQQILLDWLSERSS